jgi:hypothetical protein
MIWQDLVAGEPVNQVRDKVQHDKFVESSRFEMQRNHAIAKLEKIRESLDIG